MHVTLLYFEDCPHWRVANERLETLAIQHPSMSITRHVVDTPEEADRTGFRGSPSILINGADPFADASDPIGLSCRIYRTPEGPAGSPTLDQLRVDLARTSNWLVTY